MAGYYKSRGSAGTTDRESDANSSIAPPGRALAGRRSARVLAREKTRVRVCGYTSVLARARPNRRRRRRRHRVVAVPAPSRPPPEGTRTLIGPRRFARDGCRIFSTVSQSAPLHTPAPAPTVL